jgi:hypothetical protein
MLSQIEKAVEAILKADKGMVRIEASDHKIVYVEKTEGTVIGKK